MNAAEKQEHTQQVMKRFSFKPASDEWLAALHRAQLKAKQIQRHKGIPNSRGEVKFYVAPAEDFTNEGRRCLLDDEVKMGWFRVDTEITEINPHTQTLKLQGCYVVYHAPSSQAQVFYVEWTARSDGDALASAHTRLTRRFIQGLLQIAVVDEGIVPEDPPRGDGSGCPHPRERHTVNQDASVVCTLCGELLGYAAPAQQQQAAAPQQQQMYPPPDAAPPQQQQQAAPPPQGYAGNYGAPPAAPPQQQQAAPPPQGPPPQYTPPAPPVPIDQEPIVQAAQQQLGAEEVSPKEMRQEQSQPPEGAPVSGDPATAEGWRDALVAQGMDPENALQVSMLIDGTPIEMVLVEDMRNWAWSHYKGDVAAITKAFNDVGFEPVPSLPLDQRPRPTGIQAKRFLAQMKFKSKAATPAAQ